MRQRQHEVDRVNRWRSAADSGGGLAARDALVETSIVHRQSACGTVDSMLGCQSGGFLPELFRKRRAGWIHIAKLGQA